MDNRTAGGAACIQMVAGALGLAKPVGSQREPWLAGPAEKGRDAILSLSGARAIAVAWTAVLLLACAFEGASLPPDLVPMWQEFLTLPAERALAIAGDPRRGRWVAGASGGHATGAEAEAGALLQCRRRREVRRMQAACVLYAVGDEIVWQRR